MDRHEERSLQIREKEKHFAAEPFDADVPPSWLSESDESSDAIASHFPRSEEKKLFTKLLQMKWLETINRIGIYSSLLATL